MGKSYVVTSRYWLLEIYPESAALGWESILESSFFACAVSPLHDCDVWQDSDPPVLRGDHVAGELKKPHYHICLDCGPKNAKSILQITELARKLARDPDHPVLPIPSKGDNCFRGAVRYLIHYDHPTKYQYDISGIKVFNGFKLDQYFTTSEEEYRDLTFALEDWIEEFNLGEYWHLLRSFRQHIDEDYHGVHVIDLYVWTTKHTIHTNSLLKSRKGIYDEERKRSEFKSSSSDF